MLRKTLIGLIVAMVAHLTQAFAVEPDARPIPEWETPKAVILGGLKACDAPKGFFDQYFAFMEELSTVVLTRFFSDDRCQTLSKAQLSGARIEFHSCPLNSIWVRDYAPIWLRSGNPVSIANFPDGANYFGKQESDDQFSKRTANQGSSYMPSQPTKS